VLGPGGQGLAAVVAAHEAGAEKIIVVGLTRDEHRFEVAKLFGATHSVDVQKVDPIQAVKDLTNDMLADVVVDVTGVVKSVPLSIELVRPMGTVILASNSGPTPVSLVPDIIATKEIRYQGVFTQDAPAARAAIKLIESRRYPIEKMVTHQFPLEEAEKAVRTTGGEIEMEGFIKGVIVPN
jgi:threonine dehydrogenase-like Zn-dependent dehydrogenase